MNDEANLGKVEGNQRELAIQEYIYKKYWVPDPLPAECMNIDNFLVEYRIPELQDAQKDLYYDAKSKQFKLLSQNPKISPEEREKYLLWSSIKKYRSTISRLNLDSFIDNPFMIIMICDILPKLKEKKGLDMTKALILKTTTNDHMKRKEQRYYQTHIGAGQAHYDVGLSAYNFSMDLAVTLTLRNETSLRSKPDNYKLHDKFFAPGKKKPKC